MSQKPIRDADHGYEFEAFCRDANAALKADPGAGGKQHIKDLLEKLLKNEAFVEEVCGPDAEIGTHQIYRDPDFDFVVLAHVNGPARKSPPHDHGSPGRSTDRPKNTPT